MSNSPRRISSSRARVGGSRAARRSIGVASRTGKVRKAFWLDPRLLAEARATLGASTEREAVEIALDLVGFRKDLARSARALRGLKLSRLD
jgi:Arc/MetJ family transcription regulator